MFSDVPAAARSSSQHENDRVLVIDDNRAIHEDFRKILGRQSSQRAQLEMAAASLFGTAAPTKKMPTFQLASAFQGKEGLSLVEKALVEQLPYAVAFVDMRMPPGWDGLETICQLWKVQPDLQVVLCTAYSDYSLEQIQEKVDVADRLLILKKPFETVEVHQLARTLTEKWRLGRLAQEHTTELTRCVEQRTAELRRANESLTEQARLLELAHDAIFACDLQNRIVFWNAGAERLYGWSGDKAMGSELILELLPSSFELEEIKGSLLAHGDWSGEQKHFTKKGGEVIVSSRWTLVRDIQGEPKTILVISSDITEQKRLQEQFLRAQRLESIGTLASGVAHDLNNILAPILMCAPLLRKEIPQHKRESLVSAIESSAARGANIVKQVLAFGRGLEGERQFLSVGTLIEEVVQIAAETFPKQIHLESDVAQDLAYIFGDPTQWHQVLLNLCVNARDAMPQGGRLKLTAFNLEVDPHYAAMSTGLSVGPHVVLEVSDTGTGIPPEIQERIFDPFFTTKAVGEGTGLGLSTVAGIVKSHGGTLEVISGSDKGTTFRMVIPATGDKEAAGTEESRAKLDQRGHGELLLIVDDEEGIRCAAQSVLEEHGYEVQVAADGAEGLALYARQAGQIKLVLADLMMPIMDGTTLIRTLHHMNIQAPIIASTGLGERTKLAEVKALGVLEILHKPYAADALLAVVQRALAAG